MQHQRLPGVPISFDVNDSGRYSTADTVATRESQATFAPPYAGVDPSDRNLPFKKPVVFEETAPTKILSEDSLSIDNFKSEKRKRKRKGMILFIMLLVLVALVGAVGFFFGTEIIDEFDDENNSPPSTPTEVSTSSPTGSPTSSPTADFCETLGVTDDEMRQLLLDLFDDALARSGTNQLHYASSSIVCLPEDAWRLLDNNQRQTVSQLRGIRVSTGTLAKIHPLAFDAELVESHTECNLAANSLPDLPDNLFKDFGQMTLLILTNNDFVTLSNNIFDPEVGAPSLTTLAMNFCQELIHFPEMLLFTPNLTVLQLDRADSLAEFNPEVFARFTDITTMTQILLDPIVPVVSNPGIPAMAAALGISEDVFQL